MTILGLSLGSGLTVSAISRQISSVLGRPALSTWDPLLRSYGWGMVWLGGAAVILGAWILPNLHIWFVRLQSLWQRFENWQEHSWAKWLRISSRNGPELKQTLRFNGWDAAIGLIFLFMALILFLGRLQDSFPDIRLSGDAGNIASFAAAWAAPDHFQGDALLGDLRNIQIYSTVHIPLIRWLHHLTGNYSLGYTLLLIPTIFMQLLGFYFLGRVLYLRRGWAFLLAVVALMPVPINLGESWGIMADVLPRFSFQALLPFVLGFAFLWRNQPKRWFFLMIFTGLMTFLHPVSAPVWGMGLWLGFWLFLPVLWSRRRKWLHMLSLGITFVLSLLPFIVIYVRNHVGGTSTNYELVMQVIKNYFPADLLRPETVLAEFARMLTPTPLIAVSLVSMALILILRRDDRRSPVLLLVWALDLLLMSIVAPWVEGYVERRLRIIPLQTELVRGIRYLIPLMLVTCVYFFNELERRLKPRWAGVAVWVVGIVLAAGWIGVYPPDVEAIQKEARCITQGQWVCAQQTPQQQLIQALRTQTPIGSRIYTSEGNNTFDDYGLMVRYMAERPLVYSFKDRGLLVYSNDQALKSWLDTCLAVEQLDAIRSQTSIYLDQSLELAQKLGAQYMILKGVPESAVERLRGTKLVFKNSQYLLVEIQTIGG